MLALLSPLAGAQTAPAAEPVPSVVITANPLARERSLQASSVLSGEALATRRAATLGDTLDGLPGVAATGFGPNASRPVVRGLDGDRVRIVENGGATVDASNLSFDHAVAIEPLVIERLEVVRGPAALLYGGSATGGVVNALHNRIPRARPGTALSGRAELRAGGAAGEQAGAVVLDGSAGALAWHADAFARSARDLRVPRFEGVEVDGSVLAPAERVRNSAARAEGGALGAAWVGGDGRIGASADTLGQRYGITAEEDVTIRMQRDRLALSAEWRWRGAPIERVGVEGSHTRYRHEEVEGDGAVGTTFKSRGDELRVELRHAPIGLLGGARGVFGVQAEALDFSALGEEAFVPGTRTRSRAAFVLEEWTLGAVDLSAGLRQERARVDSLGDADPAAVRFGPPQARSFAPRSASIGAVASVAPGWELRAQWARSARAPAYYELYADGEHLATAAYERGDPALGIERSRHAEIGLRWEGADARFSVAWFETRFGSYIGLDATGADVLIPDPDGGPPAAVPEYRFSAARVRLRGAEAEGRWRVRSAGHTLELSAVLDRVQGDNLDRAEPLPRLAPLRARLVGEWSSGSWRLGAGVRHAARQDRVPATDRATPGHTLVDLWAAWRLPLPQPAVAQLRLSNAGDRLAYAAGTIGTLRGLAPLPGRALSLMLRSAF